jgi:hypothetical protein
MKGKRGIAGDVSTVLGLQFPSSVSVDNIGVDSSRSKKVNRSGNGTKIFLRIKIFILRKLV